MHLGSLVTIGTRKPKNFKLILLNNGVHGSVGDQISNGHNFIYRIAEATGYEKNVFMWERLFGRDHF